MSDGVGEKGFVMKKFLIAAAMLLSSAVAAHAVTKVEDSYIKDYVRAQVAQSFNTFCNYRHTPDAAVRDAIELGEQILAKYPSIRADIMDAMKNHMIEMEGYKDRNKLPAYCKAHRKDFMSVLRALKAYSDEDIGEAEDK